MFSLSEILIATKGKVINLWQGIIVGGFSIDSRRIKKGEAFICIKGDNFDGHKFIPEAIAKGAKAIIYESTGHEAARTQGKIPFIKVKDTVRALGDLARFNRNKFDIPVIAVTGSNGKTTTKEMISWVLSGKFRVLKNEGTKNNHIGLPMALLKLNARHDIAVLEIGSNHFGEVANLAGICRPNVGVITNIGPSHLKYFHSLGGVFKEKYSMFKYLRKPGIGIINADDQYLKKKIFTKQANTVIIGTGIYKKNDFQASRIECVETRLKFYLNNGYKFSLNTLGRHNIYNALSAIAIARIFGIGNNECATRLSAFDFPEGRLKILKLKGLNFIDDSYNANPRSLVQALEALNNFKTRGRKIFLMGDMLELGKGEDIFHIQAGKLAAKVCDVFVTVGELSRKAFMAAAANGFGYKNLYSCGNSSEARELLFKKIAPNRNDVILLKGSHSMKMGEIIK
ncbi:MAG: UDP-N-acetylmuramoyl-tripeptide--D-alanyl-D-alanine ligase [Candidatus Omnitrophota bacterium]|nr:UDP-N-acetylmuramoyl-tripeptide--D-alanyl-D-alanine ligase [Candidatus Omnitrophota bacterium]MBU1929529.1 UDP-N-acetylmuramoyl-tripeptide--D-alanyl-D-alanine ligase [Candidatus Omnitrophota bacterium]MBU2035816.1 UDP-N-acetylmuramoyl-tripeptide--D-alanyl-D-alanine ligase [Candidatus Omnitrophota bacterium]MBU2257765.1 UDP-N-acetylmuramoyl-tripeptide--D-alanyl-D-alanine ligase [Candidatus Omnitrophota bacterium]